MTSPVPAPSQTPRRAGLMIAVAAAAAFLATFNETFLNVAFTPIMADFGVVDAPAEGCVPRTGNLERDKVMQVTEAVMTALRQRGV